MTRSHPLDDKISTCKHLSFFLPPRAAEEAPLATSFCSQTRRQPCHRRQHTSSSLYPRHRHNNTPSSPPHRRPYRSPSPSICSRRHRRLVANFATPSPATSSSSFGLQQFESKLRSGLSLGLSVRARPVNEFNSTHIKPNPS